MFGLASHVTTWATPSGLYEWPVQMPNQILLL